MLSNIPFTHSLSPLLMILSYLPFVSYRFMLCIATCMFFLCTHNSSINFKIVCKKICPATTGPALDNDEQGVHDVLSRMWTIVTLISDCVHAQYRSLNRA